MPGLLWRSSTPHDGRPSWTARPPSVASPPDHVERQASGAGRLMGRSRAPQPSRGAPQAHQGCGGAWHAARGAPASSGALWRGLRLPTPQEPATAAGPPPGQGRSVLSSTSGGAGPAHVVMPRRGARTWCVQRWRCVPAPPGERPPPASRSAVRLGLRPPVARAMVPTTDSPRAARGQPTTRNRAATPHEVSPPGPWRGRGGRALRESAVDAPSRQR